MKTPPRKQIEAIAADLVAGRPVDAVSAAQQHSIWRLSSLIHRLRRRGWPVVAHQDHGSGLARYSLPDGWKPHA